jgi:hypothetical protein
VRDGEAFAASGWRNFAPLLGTTNVTTLPKKGTWITTLSTNACLWAYGAGPGSYTSLAGLGRANAYNDGVTTEMVIDDIVDGQYMKSPHRAAFNIDATFLAVCFRGCALLVWKVQPLKFLDRLVKNVSTLTPRRASRRAGPPISR